MDKIDLTLLSEGQIWGNESEKQLEVLKKYGTKAAVSDLCILTGSYYYDYKVSDSNLNNLKGRSSLFWTKSDDNANDVRAVNKKGDRDFRYRYVRYGAVRPILQSSAIYYQIFPNKVKGCKNTYEVEFGEYPQYAVDDRMQRILESELNRGGLNKTGRNYTFDSTKNDDLDIGFKGITYDEYEYQGRKFIRVKANSNFKGGRFELSNGIEYRDGDFFWVEVSPVKWLVDDETKTLISKIGLVSGIRYLDRGTNYRGDFDRTEMKSYLDNYMSRDLFQNEILSKIQTNTYVNKEKKKEEKVDSYGFNYNELTEEDILRGAIESDIPVFLHGPSSEGKSARVKQIDPTCQIIYLRNASLDSLVGKSVYDPNSGKMIDVPPSWYVKFKAKCEKEPDKIHVLFLDEITNAIRGIQGCAFNLVLDKEVNGTWKLPENARVVASGNDTKDSTEANELAEPLFNRFAHVYIKTTTEKWLEWASEHNIHPSIYSYIAFNNGKNLRTKYNGEKPNADPRKWEMASKMLYKTGKPEMLRALLGEEVTKDFIAFCKQRVITLENVLKDNYDEDDIESLNTAERYVTVTGISRVDEDNLYKARNFAKKLGDEFVPVFDGLWTHGDENRLSRIAEERMKIEK